MFTQSKFFPFATLVLVTSITGCAVNKSFIVDVPTKAGTTAATVKALKCAAQQAGWNITYTDETTVSAQKTVGMDNVPLTLNLSVQSDSPSKVMMTTHDPRGLKGSTFHERPIIDALKNCGAPDVQWAPTPGA